MIKILEILNGLLFLLIISIQIIAIIPLKQGKIKKLKIFIPFISLFLYILYESYFMLPEVSITVPIRIDLFIIHPVIIVGCITSIIRSIKMIKNKEKMRNLAWATLVSSFALAGSFIYLWFYVLLIDV